MPNVIARKTVRNLKFFSINYNYILSELRIIIDKAIVQSFCTILVEAILAITRI